MPGHAMHKVERQPTQTGSTVPDALAGALLVLLEGYAFRDPDAVIGFLERYPGLADLLVQVRRALTDFFGDAPVDLRVVDDPEELPRPELFAVVKTRLSPPEAIQRLRAFDEQWWHERLRGLDAPLVVSIELV